jgi:DHA3 family tetracycline resistance protein-like MFS transporter
MSLNQRIDAFRLHLVYTGLTSLAGALIWTGMMVYQVQIVGLTPLQLVLIGTVMEATIFLFEIPTGVVADAFSRRLSCVIGFFLVAAGYFLQLIPTFEMLLFAQLIWGIGWTFTSGAYDAWLVDEIGQERTGQAFLRGGQIGRIAGIVGILAVAIIGTVDLRLPILMGASLWLITAVLMLLFMRETGFKPTPRTERTTFGKMFAIFRDGVRVVRSRPALVRILGVGLFFGLYSEGWDRLWAAHLLITFNLNEGAIPAITLIAGLDMAMMAIGVVAAEIARRRVNLENAHAVSRALMLLGIGMVIGIVGYGIAPSLGVAVIALTVFNTARGLVDPLLRTWTNANIDSDVRATVLSIQSQTDAIGQMAGGPPIGAVGSASLRLAFVVSGAILSPAVWLLRRNQRA